MRVQGGGAERLREARFVTQLFGKSPVAISAREHEGDAAGEQQIGDRIDLAATDGDVENGGVKLPFLGKLQRLFQRRRRTDDFASAILDSIFDQKRDQHFVFNDEDSAPGDLSA